MIDLVNRRFVPFYFNVGKGQTGYDADAAAFIATVDNRFAGPSVPTPPVWILSPDGNLLATIDNYAPKDEFFAKVREVLDKHPEFNTPSAGEAKQLKAGGVAAGLIHEELGEYEKALALYEAAKADPAALLGRARIARHERKWDLAKTAVAALERTGDDAYADDVAMESAYHLLDARSWEPARTLLHLAIRKFGDSERMGEMHFSAGVASFFLEQKDWARFHWCWVMKNIPDDCNYMRCYMAATAEAMPYANPELGGYKGGKGMISHALADKARDAAMKDYEKLLPEWKAGAGR